MHLNPQSLRLARRAQEIHRVWLFKAARNWRPGKTKPLKPLSNLLEDRHVGAVANAFAGVVSRMSSRDVGRSPTRFRHPRGASGFTVKSGRALTANVTKFESDPILILTQKKR